MAGFFSMIKAINKCANELLTIGKDYAVKFKAGELTAQEYESEMVGKIYEVTNKYSNNDEDLEKHLKQHFADVAVKFLKDGIQMYTESLQQPTGGNPVQPGGNPQEPTEKQPVPKEKSKFEKSLDDLSSSDKGVTSSKRLRSDTYDKLVDDITKLL